VTTEELARFKTVDEVTFIGYLNAEDQASREAFARVAEKYRAEFTFGVAGSDVELPSGLNRPSIVCYKPIDGDMVALNPFDKLDELESWVKESSRLVISELSILNRQRLLDVSSPRLVTDHGPY
jgi:protein disulfide-isomerase A1